MFDIPDMVLKIIFLKDIIDVFHLDVMGIHYYLPYGTCPPDIHTHRSQWNHPCWIRFALATLAHVKEGPGKCRYPNTSSYKN